MQSPRLSECNCRIIVFNFNSTTVYCIIIMTADLLQFRCVQLDCPPANAAQIALQHPVLRGSTGQRPFHSCKRRSMLLYRTCCLAGVASLQLIHLLSALCSQHTAVPGHPRDPLGGHGQHRYLLDPQRGRCRLSRLHAAESFHAILLAADTGGNAPANAP